ncbi:MAG TPA: CDP-alcohol phosphatidyltransferase family protein [Candidatus Limnocylindrales bacterium]
MSGRSFVSPEFRARVRLMAVPVALLLGRLGLTPNALTIVGFLGTCVAAAAAAAQAWVLAGVLVITFGIFDLFDGALARATNQASTFGAFLDSTLDRTGENLVYVGIAVGCAAAGFTLGVGLAALAMATASVVTYARARAEAVGLHGEVGIAPRSERLVVLAIGLVVTGFLGGLGVWDPFFLAPLTSVPGAIALAIALGIISVTCAITIVQRIVHVQRQAAHR